MIAQLIFGLKVAFVGMGVTFIGLIALIVLVHANRILAESVDKMANKPKEEPAKKPAPKAEAPKAAPKAAVQKPASDNSVIAAISAAVSVMMEGVPFKVTSVKKAQTAQNTNAWDMVAIQEQNNNL